MTKKVGRNFGGGKSENFVGKGQIGEIFRAESDIFIRNRGTSEIGGKCIIASGGWTPLPLAYTPERRLLRDLRQNTREKRPQES